MPNLIAPPGLSVFRRKDQSEHSPPASMRVSALSRTLGTLRTLCGELDLRLQAQLKVELYSQLDLPRIEYGTRRSIQWIGRTLAEAGGRSRAAERRGIRRTEVSRAVHRIKEANIRCVEKIESLGQECKAAALLERDGATEAEIHRAEVVSHERVARFDANPVVIAEDVAVGIKAGELGKSHRRLDGGDQAELEISGEQIPSLRCRDCAIQHQAVPDVIGRQSAFAPEVLAVLRDEHEAWVRAVINRFGPCVADAVGEVVGKLLCDVDEQAIVLRIPP